jgi:thiol-disulfide isomerase/thioredoxin
MIRKNLILLICCFLIFDQSAAQQPGGKDVNISFDFSGLKEVPFKIFIQSSDIGRHPISSDTLGSSDKFDSYSIKAAEPIYLTISFLWKNKRFTSKNFWAVDGKAEIKFLDNLSPVVKLENREFANEIEIIEKRATAFQKTAEELVSAISYENRKVSEVESEIWKIRDSMDYAIDHEIYYKSIKENLNSPVGLYSLWRFADRPVGSSRSKRYPKQIDSLINYLSLAVQGLPSANKLKSVLRLEEGQSVGSQIKDISLPDAMGKLHKISEFRGRYVLVDFWASWCIPCRAEHPNLLKAQKQYQSSGFEIISITRDSRSRSPEWIEAISHDNISSWLHLSDFENTAQKIFNIEEIPMNFLIDPQGKIIAKNLRGIELSDKLKVILEK